MEPTQGLQRNKIALLIDFDNVILGIDDPGFDVEIVVNALRARGIVVLGRAYGDWYRHNRHRRKLMEQGIDLIETPVFGPIIKNSADMHMALDAFELAHTQPHIDTFCIVSGDSDFLPLIKRLQGRDKNVIVIAGHKFTSELVRRNCNEYLAYENLLAASVGATEDVTTLDGAFQLLRRTISTLQERSMEVRSSTVKQMMLQLNPAFSERTVGCSQFKQFLDKACTANIIKLGRRDPVSGEFNVLLPDETDIDTRIESTQSTLGAASPAETRSDAPAATRSEGRTDGRGRRRSDRRFPDRRDGEDSTPASQPETISETVPVTSATEGVTPETTAGASASGETSERGEFVDTGSALGRVPLRRGRLRFSAKSGGLTRSAARATVPAENGSTGSDASLTESNLEAAGTGSDVAATSETALDLTPQVAAEIALNDAVQSGDAAAEVAPEEKPAPKKRAPRSRKRKPAAETTATAEVETATEAPAEAPAADVAAPEEATAPAKPRRSRAPRGARAKATTEATEAAQPETASDNQNASEARNTDVAPTAAPNDVAGSQSSEVEGSAGEIGGEDGGETGGEAKPARRILRRRHGSRR